MRFEKLIKGSVVATLALSLTACATTSSVREVRTEADDAKQIAENALTEAREARRIAEEANSRASRTEEIVNRSFKKSMYK